MATETTTAETSSIRVKPTPKEVRNAKYRREPLQLKGLLDQYKHFDVTPVIGRECSDIQLTDLLNTENSDELIRDLDITISQRGWVFFPSQNALDNDLQKKLAQKLGELSGKPKTSGLQIRPIINAGREQGGKDNEISVISSEQNKKLYKDNKRGFSRLAQRDKA